ncbi:MAG: hypothetical protein ACK2UL_09385 [Anaerolineae bacterium]
MARRIPRRLAAIACVMVYLAVGLLYLDAVPPWEAPDEPWHLAYAEAMAAGRLPAAEDTYEAHQPPLYYAWLAGALRVMGVAEVPRAPDNPWFPYAAAALWHVPGDPAEPLLSALRGFSALLGCVTITLTWSATRAARGGDAAAVLAALTAGLLPQFLFVSHAVTNDTLAVAVGGLTVYGLVVWAARVGATRGAAGLMAAAGGAAVVTKLNAVTLLTASVPTAAIVAWRDRTAVKPGRVLWRAVGPLLALTAGSGAVLAAVAVTAPAAAARLADQVAARGVTVAPGAAEPWMVAHVLSGTLVSLWARFGWLTVDVPRGLTAVAGAAACVGLAGALGLIVTDASPSGAERRRSLLAAAAAVSVALVAVVRSSMSDPQPQGRLLMPALPALALLLAVGWTALAPRRFHLALVMLAAAFLIGTNVVATRQSISTAMAPYAGPPPPVVLRVMPPDRVVAAELTPAHPSAAQTLGALPSPVERVEVAVAGATGDGTLEIRVRASDGQVVGAQQYTLADLNPRTWVGVDVGGVDGRGPLTLELELDADERRAAPPNQGRLAADERAAIVAGPVPGKPGEPSVRIWGSSSDVYPGGELVTAEHGATGADLLLVVQTGDGGGS